MAIDKAKEGSLKQASIASLMKLKDYYECQALMIGNIIQQLGGNGASNDPVDPETVVEWARIILSENKVPMRRDALNKAMEARGWVVPGANKNKNLGTIIWRHRHIFKHVPKKGYALREAEAGNGDALLAKIIVNRP